MVEDIAEVDNNNLVQINFKPLFMRLSRVMIVADIRLQKKTKRDQ